MCNQWCLDFVAENIRPEEVQGKIIVESGSRDVNGSARGIVQRLGPAQYIGTDIEPGPGVDQICDAVQLVETFGEQSVDMLISTEVVEHVEFWREVISNYKRILKPGGVLFITTRSKGFPYHGYPGDYWRYEDIDMREIFSDFEILSLAWDLKDQMGPGIFIKAKRPEDFVEKDLSDYELYSINTDCRALPKSALEVEGADEAKG